MRECRAESFRPFSTNYQSEAILQIYPKPHRLAFLRKAPAHAFEIERGVVRVRQVMPPQSYLPCLRLQGDAPVQRAIEILHGIVLFRPIDFSGSCIIQP